MISVPRHFGGYLVLFADGHVETVPGDEAICDPVCVFGALAVICQRDNPVDRMDHEFQGGSSASQHIA